MSSGPACLVIAEDAEPVIVEGTVRGNAKDGHPFVLRLVDPRCVVGLARASVITEVMLVSDGFDLRPLVDARVRAVGHAIGDASAPEGPAVIVIAHRVERLAPKEEP